MAGSHSKNTWWTCLVIQKIPDQYTRKARHEENAEGSHIGRCARSSSSRSVKVQKHLSQEIAWYSTSPEQRTYIKNLFTNFLHLSKYTWDYSNHLSQYLTNLMHKICFTISFISFFYMFRAHVLIIRRSKSHYTASGIITPIGVMRFWPSDDEHMC